jgi:hypothetical protein
MKAIEFESRRNENGTLSVPSRVAQQLSAGTTVRVLLLVENRTEDDDWRELTARAFAEGYAEGDAIYDKLPPR